MGGFLGARVRLRCKVWVEKDGKPLLGEGGAELLRAVMEEGSLSAAASRLGMSYAFAWEYIRNIEETLGAPVVETRRGGRKGGGTRLTRAGEALLRLYEEAKKAAEDALRRVEAEWVTR